MTPIAIAPPVSVLVPMKRFELAKSRLRQQLNDVERARLARAMFERVLGAVCGCRRASEAWVVTNGEDVAESARGYGAKVLSDPLPLMAALGTLIDWSLNELWRRGSRRVLILMADLPYLETEDVTELIARLDDADVVMSPDRSGQCTNALGLRLPFATRTAFGDPQSYAGHLRSAQELGLCVVEVANPHVAHDVDTPADLPGSDAWLLAQPGAAAKHRTREF